MLQPDSWRRGRLTKTRAKHVDTPDLRRRRAELSALEQAQMERSLALLEYGATVRVTLPHGAVRSQRQAFWALLLKLNAELPLGGVAVDHNPPDAAVAFTATKRNPESHFVAAQLDQMRRLAAW